MFCLCIFAQAARAQQAVDVNANGMPLAQNDSAIEQARLYEESVPPAKIGVDANGTALADTEPTSSDDDSFGAQQILKNQERIRPFSLTAGASLVYTSNVALVRRGEQSDSFAVFDISAGWTPHLGNNLEANLGLHIGIFRYHDTPALDFESFDFGAGLAWAPPSWRGASIFARHDFTELLGRKGEQILMENSLTVGLQKTVSFGRSHGLAFGLNAVARFADPAAAQREEVGGFFSYHLQLTRKVETDFLYRPALHFYTDSGRIDANQILSWSVRYRITNWADLSASFSYGLNRSDHSVFDYNVLNTGFGAGLNIRF